MSRPQSPATIIRHLRREVREWKRAYQKNEDELRGQRGRMIRAEKELAEWKARFDLLLKSGAVAEGEEVKS